MRRGGSLPVVGLFPKRSDSFLSARSGRFGLRRREDMVVYAHPDTAPLRGLSATKD